MSIHEHQLAQSSKEGYSRCRICGTYKSLQPAPREQLYENNYWSHENGRSTIEEQVHNLLETNLSGISKVDKILSYIDKPGLFLEIGCAPGVLMKKAIESGHKVMGIEPDSRYIIPIKQQIEYSAIILQGYFPDCLSNCPVPFDYIVAMDVLEHIEDYKAFVQAAYSLLAPGGSFIFMAPINTEHTTVRNIDYTPQEHIWIFSEDYLREYLLSMFKTIHFDIWQRGHNIVVCKK